MTAPLDLRYAKTSFASLHPFGPSTAKKPLLSVPSSFASSTKSGLNRSARCSEARTLPPEHSTSLRKEESDSIARRRARRTCRMKCLDPRRFLLLCLGDTSIFVFLDPSVDRVALALLGVGVACCLYWSSHGFGGGGSTVEYALRADRDKSHSLGPQTPINKRHAASNLLPLHAKAKKMKKKRKEKTLSKRKTHSKQFHLLLIIIINHTHMIHRKCPQR